MKKILSYTLVTLYAAIIFTGCALMDKPYPKSHVEVKQAGQTVDLSNEKGIVVSNFEWITETTNGAKSTIRIGSLTSGVSSNDVSAMWAGQSLSKHETGQNINIILTNTPTIIREVK